MVFQFPKGVTSGYLNSVWTQRFLVGTLTIDTIIRTVVVAIERMHVSPVTIVNQSNTWGYVSNNVRVLVQVDLLCRRHVDGHHGVINFLAPCTNGGESRPVVRPGGCPLHVAIVRTRALNRSCVVAETNEGPAGHSRTCTHRRDGEYDVHHGVEVDEKENSRQGVGEERDGEEEDPVTEQEPPQARAARGDKLFRVSG